MGKKKVEEQMQTTLTIAGRPGSQRIYSAAMVDKDSYVEFYVPEWVVALSGKDGGSFKNPTWIPVESKLWIPKKSTKAPVTTDENLTVTKPGTGGNKNQRPRVSGGVPRMGEGTTFTGQKLTLYPVTTVEMQRGNKKYNQRSFRIPGILNTMAILYFVQQAIGKTKVSHFATGKTMYPVDVTAVTLDNLGSLRDKGGATTTSGTPYTP